VDNEPNMDDDGLPVRSRASLAQVGPLSRVKLHIRILNDDCLGHRQVAEWVADEDLPKDKRSGARVRSRTFGGTDSGDGDDDDGEVDANDPLRLRQLGASSCRHCILSNYITVFVILCLLDGYGLFGTIPRMMMM
jgi:hypothetical protein